MDYKSVFWEDVVEGQELPAMSKEVTATTIVAGAFASRDLMPIHHDLEFAKKQGAPDIFLNILTIGGWAGNFLTRWSGPEGELKHIEIKLGVPCFSGNTMKWQGKVSRKFVESGQHLVDIEYSATVPIGSLCRGNAVLALPTKKA
jgi:acyl dehydratase